MKKYYWEMDMYLWTAVSLTIAVAIIALSAWYLSLYGIKTF